MPTPALADASDPRPRLVQRVAATARCRPVATTALVATVSAAYQLRWVSRHRGWGGLGVDESAAAANALRFHRAVVEGGLTELASVVVRTPRLPPLVPLASLLPVVVAGRSVTAVMAGQSVFYVLASVGVAGIVRRLASAPAALVSGLVAAGLPVSVISTRHYHLSSGVAACLVLAIWTLAASSEGRSRRHMALFGALVAGMLLSRTMALAFLPAVGTAVVVVVRRERAVAWNLLIAAVVAMACAAPWWVPNEDDVIGYLSSFGYGSGSRQIESVPLALRVPIQLGLIMTDVRPALLLPLASGVVLAVRARRGAGPVAADGPCRERRALGVLLVVGLATLATTSNSGSWFLMPLEVLGVAWAGCTIWRSTPARPLRVVAVVAIVVAGLNASLISVVRPGTSVEVGDATLSVVLLGGTEVGQSFDFAEVDRRFADAARWPDRRRAEHEWEAVVREVVASVEALRPPSGSYTASLFGENRLVRAPTVDLAAERQGIRGLSVDQPARPEGGTVRDPFAAAPAGHRLVAVVRTPVYLRPPAVDDPTWPEQARSAGWHIRRRIPTPDGGEVLIFSSGRSR